MRKFSITFKRITQITLEVKSVLLDFDSDHSHQCHVNRRLGLLVIDGLLVPADEGYKLLIDHLITGLPFRSSEHAKEKWVKLNYPNT